MHGVDVTSDLIVASCSILYEHCADVASDVGSDIGSNVGSDIGSDVGSVVGSNVGLNVKKLVGMPKRNKGKNLNLNHPSG